MPLSEALAITQGILMHFLIVAMAVLLSACSDNEPTNESETVPIDTQEIINETDEVIIVDSGHEVIVTNQAAESYRKKYSKATLNKAFAQSESGAWSWKSNRTSVEHAKRSALIACQTNNKKNEKLSPCKIINVNGTWVDNS